MSTATSNGILPKGYPVRRRGSCVPAAYLILKALGRGYAVSGYVGPDKDFEHTWVECDGHVIDPTIRQFRWWRARLPVSRVEVRRQAAAEFCAAFALALSMPWTDQGYHYRKFVQPAEDRQ